MNAADYQPIIVTARRKRVGETSKSRIRFESTDGLMVQAPRAWRDGLHHGQRVRMTCRIRHATGKADCLLALESAGYQVIA